MIAEIIKLILTIIVQWPERKATAEKEKLKKAIKNWAEYRKDYEKDKADRARRAALLESVIVRGDEDKLQ